MLTLISFLLTKLTPSKKGVIILVVSENNCIDNIACPPGVALREKGNYMLEDILIESGAKEVTALDVYTDIFNLGHHELQIKNEQKGNFKGNPLGYMKNNNKIKGHYRIMFEDDFEANLKELQKADFAILNGISYFGRKNVQEHASKMYAMIFDLDGVTDDTLSNFLKSAYAKEFNIYPLPNYVVLSGHGVHLYYVFEDAIPLYPNLKIQLKELKYCLTFKMWNRYTSTEWDKVQFQGINQGFRVIGGKTKINGVKVRAFALNPHPFSIEKMNQYIPKEKRIDESKLWRESKFTLTEAKNKFPEWYEKRIEKGQKKGSWNCKEDLYNWWIGKIKEGASVGHRYFCIMCLAIYGIKSGISKKQVEEDAIKLIPFLDGMSKTEPFTENDVKSALECFDERYITFPIEDIAKISGIRIDKNKRNGRKQHDHLERARAVQNIDYSNGEWRNKDGRPSKKELVEKWRKNNPQGNKLACKIETKLSYPTIRKWWIK